MRITVARSPKELGEEAARLTAGALSVAVRKKGWARLALSTGATQLEAISALTRQNPVAITVNGKEDTVLLSHEDFQDQIHYISELEAKLAVYTHLAQAMDDIKLGRVQSADSAFADILGELENLDV